MAPRITLTQASTILAMFGLVACAKGPYRQSFWVNPQYGPEFQQQRFTLDSTECRALSNQMIPEPPPAPQPQMGNIMLNTPSGPVFGSYQSQPQISHEPWRPDGFLGGMQRNERARNRNDYAAACLGSRGWQSHERVVER